MADLLRSLGHTVVERDPDYAPAAGGLARYTRGVLDDAVAKEHPDRLERRTKAMARLGALDPPRCSPGARAPRRASPRA